jgi:hypothetical protein
MELTRPIDTDFTRSCSDVTFVVLSDDGDEDTLSFEYTQCLPCVVNSAV